MTQFHRAVLCITLIRQLQTIHPNKDITSYRLAHALGCSPQTVTNTLMRFGKRVGITYSEKEHRPTVTKRCWIVDTDNPNSKYYEHMSMKHYYTFLHGKVDDNE